VPESQSRRLAAILAADIAGYSALVGADEARAVRDLKSHQAVVLPMVGQFGGRIIDTAGDGILAEFASVVSAVECALALQKTMADGGEKRLKNIADPVRVYLVEPSAAAAAADPLAAAKRRRRWSVQATAGAAITVVVILTAVASFTLFRDRLSVSHTAAPSKSI